MKLEEITSGGSIAGIEPSVIVTVVAVVPISPDAVQLIYKTPDGTLRDRLLGRADEDTISVATQERPWSFDGDGDAFKLAVEAKRIDLAFLFDPMMAVHTSNVEPLPHQITAVYESMLPRQPLRFVLADDPGAGKTIMAGLYIRELIMRADCPPHPRRGSRKSGRAMARRVVREVRTRVQRFFICDLRQPRRPGIPSRTSITSSFVSTK